MKPDYRKAGKNLEEAVLDNSHMSAAELEKSLSDKGVDVKRFLAGANDAFRKGLQRGIKAKAAQAKAQAVVLKGSLFGDLGGKVRVELLALTQAALGGQFGSAIRARCRHKNAEAMTDEELRSWLEDIERLHEKDTED
jgi:hypothetical protein